MEDVRKLIKDAAFMIAILASMFLICFFMAKVFEKGTMTAAIVVMGVFIISLKEL